ncbi:MAG: hypothetical protein LC732_01950 [Acidobacteria bacterium]|nr:hypothetical protein [Acidobacteriota bacterium]
MVRGLGRLSDPSRLSPWLLSIARRAVIDHIRRRSSRPAAVELEEETHPTAEPSAERLGARVRAANRPNPSHHTCVLACARNFQL